MTAYAEIIGDPIDQSQSGLIHRYWLRKLAMGGDSRSQLVSRGELATYLEERRTDPDWLGCNVTMPHKEAVVELVDCLTVSAKQIGAVNLIVRKGEKLVGSNCDASGFMTPILDRLDHFPKRRAAIFGSGGAARAIALALADAGFVLEIFNRDPARARQLAKGLGSQHKHRDFAFMGSEEARHIFGLLVNSTPLGMKSMPDPCIDLRILAPGATVYDLVYNPLETHLLKAARTAGFRTITGLEMLISQAAISFEALFGPPAPREFDEQLRWLLTP
jgi:shikimate dehydrogenase